MGGFHPPPVPGVTKKPGTFRVKYSFNKVIKCVQSVRNIAKNPPCALRSCKLFFFLQFCALLFFDILTRRTKDTDVYSIHHHPIWFFRSIESTMWRFYEGKKMTGLTSCWLRANTWKSSIKRQKKPCQDHSYKPKHRYDMMQVTSWLWNQSHWD